MNQYERLRHPPKVRVTSVLLVILLLLEVCSLALLFNRIILWSPEESANIFPLTESTAMTKVRVGSMGSDGTVQYADSYNARTIAPMAMLLSTSSDPLRLLSAEDPEAQPEGNPPAANPGVEVYDENTVWQGNTNVEIFRFTYEGCENKVTVAGSDEDKLIAPGTQNTYSFTIKNTGNVSLDYTMTMRAYVTGTDLTIPVTARVIGHDGSYLLGSADEYVDVLRLSEVDKKGTLAAERYSNYTLEWMWPFEGDDEYDTMLGNLATEGDLTLTVEIETTAQFAEDPEDPGENPPQTGDDMAFTICLAVIAIVVMLILITYSTSRRARRVENE